MRLNCQQFISQISEFIDGELDPASRQAVVEHSHHCPPCHVLLDTTARAVRMITKTERTDIPQAVSVRLHEAVDRVLVTSNGATEPVATSSVQSVRGLRGWRNWLGFRTFVPVGAVGAVGAVAVATALLAGGTTTLNGWLIDAYCARNANATTARTHERMCDMGAPCRAVGYGVMTADGRFWKFDPAGDRKALATLQATTQKDDLRVRVTGREHGNAFAVSTLYLISKTASADTPALAPMQRDVWPVAQSFLQHPAARSSSPPVITSAAFRF